MTILPRPPWLDNATANPSQSPLPKPRIDPQRKDRPPLSRRDAAWMGLGLLLTFVVSYMLGVHRVFWEDEMLGWMLLTDPSWHHMISAWKLGADGGGFAFYLSGRLWFWFFGPSEISFRFYSAACFGLAFCVLWIALRRFYERRTVAFALFNTWFFSPPIVTHMAEGRFYGLLMLGVALAAWLVLKADETSGTPAYVCVLMFLAHGLLTTSHLLGVVYSATLLASLIFLDWMRGRFRLVLYLSAAVTWLLLLPERAAMRASAQVGNPHFWTTPPNLSRLIGAYSAFSSEVAAVLLGLGVALFLMLRRSPAGWKAEVRRAYTARRPAYVVASALLLVPVEIMLEGLVGPSLFINRYLMPVAIAQAYLTAEAVHLLSWPRLLGARRERKPWFLPSAVLGFSIILLLWDFEHLAGTVMPHKNLTDRLTARLPKGVPVLCEDAWIFTELIGRQHASGVQYIYLLDWAQSTSAAAPRLEVTEYHLMENWKKVGYFAGSIQYRDEFLKQNSRFLLIHTKPSVQEKEPPMIGNPLLDRFRNDPAYQVLRYGGKTPAGLPETWLVCRHACDSV